ncbi:MAG: cupin domain-containing protein [Gaiellales bacterium]|jgi:quercetin dioxygenase-like cupin family protein
MTDYTVVDAGDVEAMRGAFRKMRLALGTNAFGINQIELPAGASGPEHDEEDTTHEEVYVVLTGTGTLSVEGEEIALEPGRYVRVGPSVSRQMTAGDGGITFIAVGAPAAVEWTGRPTL